MLLLGSRVERGERGTGLQTPGGDLTDHPSHFSQTAFDAVLLSAGAEGKSDDYEGHLLAYPVRSGQP